MESLFQPASLWVYSKLRETLWEEILEGDEEEVSLIYEVEENHVMIDLIGNQQRKN